MEDSKHSERRTPETEASVALPMGTVTIEVVGGLVQNVYASPDLPPISVEVLDFDNLRDATEEEYAQAERQLKAITKHHIHIY